jgi:16S rRNA (guanine527-N7)-methyltransferase
MKAALTIFQKYVPELGADGHARLLEYSRLLHTANERINLISRKDTAHIPEHHILHSLAIYKTGYLKAGMQVLDIGTGGGLPGIPLAIAYPKISFLLIDRIGKKIGAVNEIISAMGLDNVVARQADAAEIKQRFDAITARAVTNLPDFLNFALPRLAPGGQILYLRGGDMPPEIDEMGVSVVIHKIFEYFPTAYFDAKQVVRVYGYKGK